MDEILVYFLLRLSLLITSYIIGWKIIKKGNYWKHIWIPILLFTLIEGLRFGRGVDYNGYYLKYNDILLYGLQEAKEFMFVGLCKVNDFVGFSYQGIVLIMSLILIVSGAFFMKDHIKALPFAFPLFCLFTLDAENLMRWFLGFSFILIAISYLDKENKKLFWLFSLLGISFHNGLIIVVPIFYILHYLKRPILYPIIAIAIYLLLHIFFSTQDMLYFVNIVSMLNTSDQFSGYTSNAEAWLTGTANYIADPLNIGTILMDIITIFLGYKVVKLNHKLTYIYNIYLIGVVLSPALYQIEIIMRIDMLFKLFQFLIIAYAIYYFVVNKTKENRVLCFCTWIVIINILRIYLLNIFFIKDSNTLLFVWDSMGRNVLQY